MDRGVEDEFREFVRARTPSLLGTAYLLTGDHGRAEDLVQVALLKAYRHWKRVTSAGSPDAYVRRILINEQLSWWRRRRIDAVSIPAYHDSVAGTAEDASADLAERDRMWRALHQLPPRMRAVIVLRYREDMSEAVTAELLGCSVGTVKSLCSRGLARLREVLDPAGEAPDDRDVERSRR
jgi:RNA polymerase sigma-70 factor (sigma-E family)